MELFLSNYIFLKYYSWPFSLFLHKLAIHKAMYDWKPLGRPLTDQEISGNLLLHLQKDKIEADGKEEHLAGPMAVRKTLDGLFKINKRILNSIK